MSGSNSQVPGSGYDRDAEAEASFDRDVDRMFEHRDSSTALPFPQADDVGFDNPSPPPLYPGEQAEYEEQDFETRHRANCPSVREPLGPISRPKVRKKQEDLNGSAQGQEGQPGAEQQLKRTERASTGNQEDSSAEPLVPNTDSTGQVQFHIPEDSSASLGPLLEDEPGTMYQPTRPAYIAVEPAARKISFRLGGSSGNLADKAGNSTKGKNTDGLEGRRRKGSEVELTSYPTKGIITAQSSPDAGTLVLNESDRHQQASQRFVNNPGVSRPRYNYKRSMSSPQFTEKRPLALSLTVDRTPHELFVELDELSIVGEGADSFWEWKEKARWIKFEEDVLESAERWDKPHVASLSFHSLLELRKGIENGAVLLDVEAKTFGDLLNNIVGSLIRCQQIKEDQGDYVLKALSVRHSHLFDKTSKFHKSKSHANLKMLDSMSSRVNLKMNLQGGDEGENGTVAIDMEDSDDIHSPLTGRRSVGREERDQAEYNMELLKRIPANAQVASVLVGTMEELTTPAFAFVRLREASHLHNLAEVPLPVRFIFVCLGPLLQTIDYLEVGRSISTLMADKRFHDQVYMAKDRMGIIQAMNGFLDDSMVLPPGDFDKSTLMPMLRMAKQGLKKRQKLREKREGAPAADEVDKAEEAGEGEKEEEEEDPLRRTRRPFGGLINDIRKRYPKYWSDIRDGINLQCLSAFIFIYFAALAPAITFGGLIGDKVNKLMGASEMMLASAVGGLAFSLFAGQPLLIVGATGPLLVFEESMYKFCEENAIEFMTFRVWIGVWVLLIALVIVGVEGSFLVRFISRFTQEIFAFLISLIFILETFFKLGAIFGEHPLTLPVTVDPTMLPENATMDDVFKNETGAWVGDETVAAEYSHEPNTALLSLILTLGTFAIAWVLKDLRNKKILGRTIRRALGDFGVPLAIFIMVVLDYFVDDVYTTKLDIPSGLEPTDTSQRGWLIPPMGKKGTFPIWLIPTALLPALLVFILIFMESQITGMILNKKDNKLQKGTGFHLDMIIVGAVSVVCGFMGLPFVCCATVRSVSHISSLMVWSKNNAPGEPQKLVGVVEQRVTGFFVSVFIGISVFLSPLLKMIPVAVLFGVFLYMGIASLGGIQLYERIQLFITPQKHYPDSGYVRKVKKLKIHLFTFIQILCLALLWGIKSTEISLAFPFILIMMVPLRHFLLPKIFSEDELSELDRADSGKGPENDALVDEDEADFYETAHMPD